MTILSQKLLQDYIYQYCRIAQEFKNYSPERKTAKRLPDLYNDINTLKVKMDALTNELADDKDREILDNHIRKCRQLSQSILQAIQIPQNTINFAEDITVNFRI